MVVVAGVVAAVTLSVVGGVATDQSTAAGTKAAADRLKPGLLVLVLVLVLVLPCNGVWFRGSDGAGALGRANRTGLLAALELDAVSIPLPACPAAAANGTGDGPSIEANAEPNGDAGGTRIKALLPPAPNV